MEESPRTAAHHEEERSDLVDIVVFLSAHEIVPCDAVGMPTRRNAHTRRGDILVTANSTQCKRYVES